MDFCFRRGVSSTEVTVVFTAGASDEAVFWGINTGCIGAVFLFFCASISSGVGSASAYILCSRIVFILPSGNLYSQGSIIVRRYMN